MDTKKDYQPQINKAVELFKKGYSCSQAVFTAFSDEYGFSQEQALRIAAPFGAGIGRMRETCGAACGLFLLAGQEKGNLLPSANDKAACYQLVQELAATFKERMGSINCGELLGLHSSSHITTQPEERTKEYYKKRPCAQIVENAACIWADYLLQKQEK